MLYEVITNLARGIGRVEGRTGNNRVAAHLGHFLEHDDRGSRLVRGDGGGESRAARPDNHHVGVQDLRGGAHRVGGRLTLGKGRDIAARRITSYNVCYTKLLRVQEKGRGTKAAIPGFRVCGKRNNFV